MFSFNDLKNVLTKEEKMVIGPNNEIVYISPAHFKAGYIVVSDKGFLEVICIVRETTYFISFRVNKSPFEQRFLQIDVRSFDKDITYPVIRSCVKRKKSQKEVPNKFSPRKIHIL